MKTITLSALTVNKNHNSIKYHRLLFICLSTILCFSILYSAPSYSHRGSADEVDNCRIKVGFEKVHFTAYTPKISQSKGYCQFIPNVGLTNLVFDFEGKKLRDVTIEFEVTKEPEGTRIFYQQPKKNKTGTMNATVDFSKYGAGEYLAHVTIVHKGDKLDSHLSFNVGSEKPNTPWGVYMFLLVFALLIVYFFILNRTNKINKQTNKL